MMPADPAADEIADLIVARIGADGPSVALAFAAAAAQGIGCAWLDDVLPPALVAAITATLPLRTGMTRRRLLGERKFVSAQTAHMAVPLARLVQALASARVADAFGRAVGLPLLAPDPELYNGGVTIMAPGDFMRPHLDNNSHDGAGRRRRRWVALFYLSQNGGRLGPARWCCGAARAGPIR